jgi:hypothetical protein
MDITKETIIEEIAELSGENARQLFDKGLLNMQHARKWIVVKKYFRLAKTGRSLTDIKYELSAEYGISVSLIEKMVYRKVNSE